MTGVPLDSVVTTTTLSENHGVSLPTMDIYSVPLRNAHVLVRINTLIMNHVQVNIQRKQRAILGLSLMWFTRHGRIANWRSIEALNLVRLDTSEC